MRTPESGTRVVVTGVGVVSALGLDERSFWDGMLAGRCGIRPLRKFDATACRTRVASEVDDALLAPSLQALGIRASDPSVDYGILAAAQALEQAGLRRSGEPPEPVDMAVILGTGAGPSKTTFDATRGFLEKGLRGIRPTTVPSAMLNAVSARISLQFRLRGPNYIVASACTTSTAAIGVAFRLIRHGYAERALTGGTDAMIHAATFGAWNNLGVMSANPDPEIACRPFDRDRDGMILGDGAGVLVLESLESARARGATIRAELLGFGESSDAVHLTRPDPEGQARAIRTALDSAGVEPRDIGFINAHGTATRANDPCEAQAIRSVFGGAIDGVRVASNKSFFGHTLGACGALETIATILGLEAGRVPGNRNLDNPDPECDLPLVGKEALAIESPLAMKNSFGFGGHNAVLVIRRWEKEATDRP